MLKLFSLPTCPKCVVLKKKLAIKGIEYLESQDIEEMKSLGIMSTPTLQVDGKLLGFVDANAYINSL